MEDSTQCQTDWVEIDLCELKELTEQSVILLAKVFNNMPCNRRL